jgi:hypothetical protein
LIDDVVRDDHTRAPETLLVSERLPEVGQPNLPTPRTRATGGVTRHCGLRARSHAGHRRSRR